MESFAGVPRAVASPDDLLEMARNVVDADAEALCVEVNVSCRAGCGACCSQAVPVTVAEVRSIRDFIADMDAGEAEEVRARITHARRRLAEIGITPELFSKRDDPTGRDPRWRSLDEFSQRYFDAAVPCPLLSNDGECSVRSVRPLVCREYLVTSDPTHCATLDGEKIVRIRTRRDVLAGFSKLSSVFGEPTVGVLALMLDGQLPQAPQADPVSGVAAVQVLTSQQRR